MAGGFFYYVVMIEVVRLSGTLGAEIQGINLKARLSTDLIAFLKEQIYLHKVIFIKRQNLSQDEHILFAEHFGVIERGHPLIKGTTNSDVIFEIDYTAAKTFDPYKDYNVKESKGGRGLGVAWHTDVTFMERPPRFSILNAVIMPPYGGDTIWSDQTEAFNSLSTKYQDVLIGSSAIHSSMTIDGKTISTEHPVVISHPDSGEPCLYVNQSFTTKIRGFSKDESQSILDYVYRHSCQHQFSVRYHWTQGDIAIWDNRNTQHAVVGDFGSMPRKIQRITVEGENPQPYVR